MPAVPGRGRCAGQKFFLATPPPRSIVGSMVDCLAVAHRRGVAEAGQEDGDAELVAAVQSGRMAAFDILVRRHRPRVVGVLYHLTGNREDAADLCQEAFVRALCHIHDFRGRSKFYTWLYRIAVNLALEQMRRRRLRSFYSLEQLASGAESDGVVLALASQLKTDKALLIKELQQQLNGALQELSPKHRTVVVLAEVEGLSMEEIGQVLGCSTGTVRSRLHYGKERLRSLLGRYLQS